MTHLFGYPATLTLTDAAGRELTMDLPLKEPGENTAFFAAMLDVGAVGDRLGEAHRHYTFGQGAPPVYKAGPVPGAMF